MTACMRVDRKCPVSAATLTRVSRVTREAAEEDAPIAVAERRAKGRLELGLGARAGLEPRCERALGRDLTSHSCSIVLYRAITCL